MHPSVCTRLTQSSTLHQHTDHLCIITHPVFAEAECIVNLLIHALARLSEDRLAENALVLASALTKVSA